jgi:PhnB protein
MSRVTTYLNFQGTTEEAFRFYGTVFGTEIAGPIARIGDLPTPPGMPEPSDAEKQMVAHIELPILAGHMLMGTDMLESMGKLQIGNNITINLDTDTRAEADRFYAALSEGGSDSAAMQDVPWGYWGCTLDRYGIRWMFNCAEQAA